MKHTVFVADNKAKGKNLTIMNKVIAIRMQNCYYRSGIVIDLIYFSSIDFFRFKSLKVFYKDCSKQVYIDKLYL